MKIIGNSYNTIPTLSPLRLIIRQNEIKVTMNSENQIVKMLYLETSGNLSEFVSLPQMRDNVLLLSPQRVECERVKVNLHLKLSHVS